MTHQEAIDGLASERYLLNEMSEDERFEFESHYFECLDCAEDVKLGEMIRQESRRAGAVAPPASSGGVQGAKVLTSPRWWRKPMVAAPWAAAASLALIAGYQSLVQVPALREANGPQAIEPVMLRGATRGAATSIAVAPGQRFVALSADVMTDGGSKLNYEIVNADRAAVASGDAQQPSSGVPLMLLIPADELRPAGRYTLIVRRADQNAAIGEYEFEVSY
jgi:hypothetical protein